MYATGHLPGASTPNFPLHAHSVLSRGMAKTPLPRVRQQLPLQRLPAVRQQALHPTSAVSEGHLNVCPATLHTSPPHRGQQLPLRVATPLICPQALRQTSTASTNGARMPGEQEDWDAMRQNTASACSKPYLSTVVDLLRYTPRCKMHPLTPPHLNLRPPTLRWRCSHRSCHHQLRTNTYRCDRSACPSPPG